MEASPCAYLVHMARFPLNGAAIVHSSGFLALKPGMDVVYFMRALTKSFRRLSSRGNAARPPMRQRT